MIEQPKRISPSGANASCSYSRCFSTLGCPELSLVQVADLALEFDISCLELRILNGSTNLPEQLAVFPGGWRGAHEFLQERNLQARVLGTSFKLVGHDHRAVEELFAFADLAEALQCPYLRAFGGGVWGETLTDAHYCEAEESLALWHRERAQKGWKVDLLVETHDAFSASAPCMQLLKKLENPVHFIWDSHHTWRLGGETPEQTWTALAPYVKHIHLNDSISQPSARHPYTCVLPGTGEMPGSEVFRLLSRDGFDGAVSLEWPKKWHLICHHWLMRFNPAAITIGGNDGGFPFSGCIDRTPATAGEQSLVGRCTTARRSRVSCAAMAVPPRLRTGPEKPFEVSIKGTQIFIPAFEGDGGDGPRSVFKKPSRMANALFAVPLEP